MKFAGDKFESQIYREAANSARGKYISGAFEPDGHFSITAGGKVRPAISYAQESFGVRSTWEFLTSERRLAHDPRVGRFIADNIDY